MGSAFIIGGTILIIILVSGIIIFLFAFTKRNWKFKNEKERMQNQFSQSLLETQIEIQEQTLKTISQEIHDNVGQVLSLAKLNLNTINLVEGEEKEQKISGSISLLTKAIGDLRELSRSIHGDKIADLGFKNALINEIKIIKNTGQLNAELHVSGEHVPLQKQQETVMFRIVQEAMNNALKHSQAKNLYVFIEYLPNTFQMKITDDGKGFETEKLTELTSGIGLRNMRDRTKLIGAKFSIDSIPGSGTSLTVSLPLIA